jgi:hypothetical protein
VQLTSTALVTGTANSNITINLNSNTVLNVGAGTFYIVFDVLVSNTVNNNTGYMYLSSSTTDKYQTESICVGTTSEDYAWVGVTSYIVGSVGVSYTLSAGTFSSLAGSTNLLCTVVQVA